MAASILIGALASLAQLVVSSSRVARLAASRSTAALLAVDKMEQLRAMRWTVSAAGVPVSDAALASSPPDALDRDAPGYSDAPLGSVRRWSIQPSPSNPDVLIIQVRVAAADGSDVRFVTARARRGS